MRKRIVIIDDDCVIQESLQEFFSDAGYAASVAVDGVSGLELIAREKPDLVVTDILLPRLHGIALCEKLKSSDDFRSIPVILMTGVYKDSNLRLYVHKGLAEDFIEKPFRQTELLAKVEKLIGKAPAAIEVQPGAQPAAASQRRQSAPPGRSLDRALDDLVNWAHDKGKK